MQIHFHKIQQDYPYELLLLADETVEAIDKYLYDSDVYIASAGKETIGVFCLFSVDEQTAEIKNIAVSPKWQGKGTGSRLLQKAEEITKKNGCETIIVGTPDCSKKQIRFYEKNGYRAYAVKENFFLENYPQPIYENGALLKDMIMLKKDLEEPQPQCGIQKATASDYPEIMQVWESSVKATHHFLKAEDFEFYKQSLLTNYLPAVDLYVLSTKEKMVGFMGVAGQNLEMLFIEEKSIGKGYGKILLNYAVRHLAITKLEVNEQNTQAAAFYKKAGFKVIRRSEKDAMNKNYPILYLELPRKS